MADDSFDSWNGEFGVSGITGGDTALDVAVDDEEDPFADDPNWDSSTTIEQSTEEDAYTNDGALDNFGDAVGSAWEMTPTSTGLDVAEGIVNADYSDLTEGGVTGTAGNVMENFRNFGLDQFNERINDARNAVGNEDLSEDELVSRFDEFGENTEYIANAPTNLFDSMGMDRTSAAWETGTDWFFQEPLESAATVGAGVNFDGERQDPTGMDYFNVGAEVLGLGAGNRIVRGIGSAIPTGGIDNAVQAGSGAVDNVTSGSWFDNMFGSGSGQSTLDNFASGADDAVPTGATDDTGSVFDNILGGADDATTRGQTTIDNFASGTDDAIDAGTRSIDDLLPSNRTLAGLGGLGALGGVGISTLGGTGGVLDFGDGDADIPFIGGEGEGDANPDQTPPDRVNLQEQQLTNAVLVKSVDLSWDEDGNETGRETLGFSILIGVDGQTPHIVDSNGNETTTVFQSVVGNPQYLPPTFDTQEAALQAHSEWVHGGNASGWMEGQQVATQLGWQLYAQQHRSEDKTRFYAVTETNGGEKVYLGKNGKPKDTSVYYDTQDALISALEKYAEHVKNGNIPDDRQSSGRTPDGARNPEDDEGLGSVVDAVTSTVFSPVGIGVIALAVIGYIVYKRKYA